MPGYGCGVHRHFARVLSGDHPHASNAKCSKLRTSLNSSIPQPNNLTNIQQEIIYGFRTNRITWGKIGDIRSTRNSQEASALPPKNYCKSRPAPLQIHRVWTIFLHCFIIFVYSCNRFSQLLTGGSGSPMTGSFQTRRDLAMSQPVDSRSIHSLSNC